MTIYEAVRKSIEGGYFPFDKGEIIIDDIGIWHQWESEDGNGENITIKAPLCWEHSQHFNSLLLDSNFWRCLGKAKGWGLKKMANGYGVIVGYDNWQYQWHNFIDFLSNGGKIEEFFENL